jgi:hypothetical protein
LKKRALLQWAEGMKCLHHFTTHENPSFPPPMPND